MNNKKILMIIAVVGFLMTGIVGYTNIIRYLDKIIERIALIEQGTPYEIKHLQYQLTELQECCNGKRNNQKQLVFNNREAILPNGIDENDN